MLAAVSLRSLSRALTRTLPQSCLFSSACPPHSSLGHGHQGQKGQDETDLLPGPRWSLSVSPFLTLRAQLTSSCSLSVSPLDLHAFPSADRAFVSLHQLEEGHEPQVHYDEERRELSISGGGGEGTVFLEAPIKTNLFISTEGRGHVHIRKMECDCCRVSTQQGDCTLHSVKGHQVEVRSSGGTVTGLGTIHGNVDIVTTGDSAVDVKKLQGTRMNVCTEHGPLKVKAIYAESSRVSSSSGRVELGHVHGSGTVQNGSGDTVINGSNSFLNVSSISGNIDVYIGEGGSAHIDSQQGSVSVRVPSSLSAGLDLCGTSLDVDPQLLLTESEQKESSGLTMLTGVMNKESSSVQSRLVVRTSASIRLRTQSWFQSLRLTGS